MFSSDLSSGSVVLGIVAQSTRSEELNATSQSPRTYPLGTLVSLKKHPFVPINEEEDPPKDGDVRWIRLGITPSIEYVCTHYQMGHYIEVTRPDHPIQHLTVSHAVT